MTPVIQNFIEEFTAVLFQGDELEYPDMFLMIELLPILSRTDVKTIFMTFGNQLLTSYKKPSGDKLTEK